MKKTIVSLMLVLVLVISLLPAGALAAGRTLELKIVSDGSTTSNTTFDVYEGSTKLNSTPMGLQTILGESEERLPNPGTLIKKGDTLILPEGNLYYTPIADVYGDITIQGAGESKTILYVLDNGGTKSRGFRLYNRYKNDDISDITFKDLTLDGSLGSETEAGFVLTCYNINLTVENVTVRKFGSAAFSAWANDTYQYPASAKGTYPTKSENVGIKIDLKNVNTKDNGYTAHFDPAPYKGDTFERYGFIILNYDGNSSFDDESGDYSYNSLTYSFNSSVLPDQNNVIINNAYVSYGDITPIAIPTPVPNATSASSSVPQTGDNSTPLLWMALVVLSASAVLMMRRKAYNR